jgi:hypothetical protein
MEVLDFEELKTGLHGALLSRIDLEKLSAIDDATARRAVATMIQEIIAAQKVPLNAAEKERVEVDLLDEVFGLRSPGDPFANRRQVPGRPAPAAGDRPHRVPRGPPGG